MAFEAGSGHEETSRIDTYSQEENGAGTPYIKENLLEVAAFGPFNEEDANRAAKITADSIHKAAISRAVCLMQKRCLYHASAFELHRQ